MFRDCQKARSALAGFVFCFWNFCTRAGVFARFVRHSWFDMLAGSILDLVWREYSPYRYSSEGNRLSRDEGRLCYGLGFASIMSNIGIWLVLGRWLVCIADECVLDWNNDWIPIKDFLLSGSESLIVARQRMFAGYSVASMSLRKSF